MVWVVVQYNASKSLVTKQTQCIVISGGSVYLFVCLFLIIICFLPSFLLRSRRLYALNTLVAVHNLATLASTHCHPTHYTLLSLPL